MDILNVIKDKARAAQRTVVLPEGTEERTVVAARTLIEEKIAKVILLGDTAKISQLAELHGLDANLVQIIDPVESDDYDAYTDLLFERRKAKGAIRRPTP